MNVRITTFGPREYLAYTGRIRGDLFFVDATPQRPTIASIQKAVSERFEIPIREMTSERRSHAVSHPRQVAMYLSKQLTPRSLPEIGRKFGNRDHTTVIHAIRQVEKRRREDPELDKAIKRLTRELSW